MFFFTLSLNYCKASVLQNTNFIYSFMNLNISCNNQNSWIIKIWVDNFDIIVEDGLHTFNANVCFLENSIHKLKQNGFFIIEDILPWEQYLFVNKIKDWESQYKGYIFKLLKVQSKRNINFDNTLLVVFKCWIV